MRIAVLADAHGNLLALQAVLADLQAVAPDLVVNLGDLATGPFDPTGSADAQMALDYPTVAGNHERNLLERDDTSSSVAFARPLLSPAHMQEVSIGAWEWADTGRDQGRLARKTGWRQPL